MGSVDINAANNRRRHITFTTAYIGVGSNIGHRRKNMKRALRLLANEKGVTILAVSSLYNTQPIGGPPQRDFLNGVVKVKTQLSPLSLLRALKRIENTLGRHRRKKWAPRTIDLDILAFGQLVQKYHALKIPHPRYHLRRFVLVPFCELAPGFTHPTLKKKNSSLLRQLTLQDQRVTMVAKWTKSQSLPSKRRKNRKSR